MKCSLEILCQTVPVLLMTQVRNVFLQLGYKEEFNPEKKIILFCYPYGVVYSINEKRCVCWGAGHCLDFIF